MFIVMTFIFLALSILFGCLWFTNAGEYRSKFLEQKRLLDQFSRRICDLNGQIYVLNELNEKKFPAKEYNKIKFSMFMYLEAVDEARNLDIVQEAEVFLQDLSEEEKMLFEYELEGLEKKIAKAKNKFCSFCGGHGAISSTLEIGGRLIDGETSCRYCNGSGLF